MYMYIFVFVLVSQPPGKTLCLKLNLSNAPRVRVCCLARAVCVGPFFKIKKQLLHLGTA